MILLINPCRILTTHRRPSFIPLRILAARAISQYSRTKEGNSGAFQGESPQTDQLTRTLPPSSPITQDIAAQRAKSESLVPSRSFYFPVLSNGRNRPFLSK